jgi:hypothetical protein
MFKTIFYVIVLLQLGSVYGQKFEFKKSKILQAETPIATYSAKGGVFRNRSVKVSSLEGFPLMELNERGFDFENPLYEGARWVNVHFQGSIEKNMQLQLGKDNLDEKKFMSLFFNSDMPTLIVEGKLNSDAVDAFIKSKGYDYTADSIRVRQFELENKARIDTATRIGSAPFSFQLQSKENTDPFHTKFTYNITQNDNVVGRLEKTEREAIDGKLVLYSFYRSTSPFVYNGQTTTFSPVAYLSEPDATFEGNFILMTNKSKIKIKTPNPVSAEYQLLKYLIDKGLF